MTNVFYIVYLFMEFCPYLFVYGTLLNQQNEFGAYLKAHSSFYKNGRFKGKLYDIGEYPGAVYDPESSNYVYGNILFLNSAEKTLKLLDDYEGFGDKQPQPNEYIRDIIEIEAGAELVKCWVYLYNLPIENFPQIKTGKYI
jgi:gamma-glutamylcyclotransferase (GGCT)/AIG2-like uncharacterized protein YtfP